MTRALTHQRPVHSAADDDFEILLYSIKLYIGVTTSISFALSTFVIFILPLQSVNEAQFLNIIIFSLLFGLAGAPGFGIVIFFEHVCTHHYNDINLILIWNF